MSIKLVLFDLDGTLAIPTVGSRITYMVIKGYSEYVGEKLNKEPDLLETAVIKSLKSLREHVPGDETIDKVFISRIAKESAVNERDLYEATKQFYEIYFKKYREFYRPAPYAKEVIEEILSRGLKVGIATDPIVFLNGVMQRLKWVGLHEFDYCVITAAENSHYVKPHLEYYIETIGKCSTSPTDTLMVGNTYNFDIKPVKELGGKALYISYEEEHFNISEKIESLKDVLNHL